MRNSFPTSCPSQRPYRQTCPKHWLCRNTEPFIWNIHVPAAAGLRLPLITGSQQRFLPGLSGRLQEANESPGPHSSYLLFVFPRLACSWPAKRTLEGSPGEGWGATTEALPSSAHWGCWISEPCWGVSKTREHWHQVKQVRPGRRAGILCRKLGCPSSQAGWQRFFQNAPAGCQALSRAVGSSQHSALVYWGMSDPISVVRERTCTDSRQPISFPKALSFSSPPSFFI